jgi:superfamily I DNA and/or RNA helicase
MGREKRGGDGEREQEDKQQIAEAKKRTGPYISLKSHALINGEEEYDVSALGKRFAEYSCVLLLRSPNILYKTAVSVSSKLQAKLAVSTQQ